MARLEGISTCMVVLRLRMGIEVRFTVRMQNATLHARAGLRKTKVFVLYS